MTGDGQILAALVVIGVVTVALRATPFVLGSAVRDAPLVAYLNRTMPAGVMVILVLYTLRDVDPGRTGSVVPAAVALAATVALHRWRGTALLSIVGGTATFVVLTALLG